jgi:pyruvate/2-oxoglutarate dehydrogenase complex dihydrolipoamide acyltransferase (E2) component
VPTQPSAPAQPAPSAPSGQQAAANGEAAGGDTYVPPLVRKLASEHNVDL